MEYLPESVNSYINKTWEEGRDVAYDLYDDIKEEVISKSDVHVDAMTEMMERFFERANEIHSSIKRVRKWLLYLNQAIEAVKLLMIEIQSRCCVAGKKPAHRPVCLALFFP